MEVNTNLEPALAERPVPAIDSIDLDCNPRWRRRETPAGAFEHVDSPLADDAHADAEAVRAPPQLAPRDAELWLLARRTQGAALRLDFELRSALVRQVFRRDFVYVSRQLHGLEASRRVQGLDRAALSEALAALQRRGDDVLALLRQIASDLDTTLATQAPASARLAFARPARFQATIVSPSAHRYLALLIQADEALARLEMAWLLGLVAAPHRSALLSDCRRALHGFKELACQRRQAVGELVREVNAQRRESVAMESPGAGG